MTTTVSSTITRASAGCQPNNNNNNNNNVYVKQSQQKQSEAKSRTRVSPTLSFLVYEPSVQLFPCIHFFFTCAASNRIDGGLFAGIFLIEILRVTNRQMDQHSKKSPRVCVGVHDNCHWRSADSIDRSTDRFVTTRRDATRSGKRRERARDTAARVRFVRSFTPSSSSSSSSSIGRERVV